MILEWYSFPLSIRATNTCTCTVAVVGVKIIMFQCFDKLVNFLFCCFVNLNKAIAWTLCVEKEINFYRLSVMFSVIFWNLKDGNNRNKKTNILFYDIPIDLWYIVNNLVNFIRRLTSINILSLAYLKHELCSRRIVSVMFLYIQISLDHICSSKIYVTH